jgi:hypothetical protein
MTKWQQQWHERRLKARTAPLLSGTSNTTAFADKVAWDLASLLCRRCWQPWWKHGHGPFGSLIDEPAIHLFDAL